MDHVTRHITRLVCLPLLLFLFSAVVDGQDRRSGRRPSSGPAGGRCFERARLHRGYYYDPSFVRIRGGPHRLPASILPIYDLRAEVRVQATPKTAAVYVDGFYAGIADDFDGVFSRCRFLRWSRDRSLFEGIPHGAPVALPEARSTLKLHETMEPLQAGAVSEPPTLAPPIPPPPAGSYRQPRTPRPPREPDSRQLRLRRLPPGRWSCTSNLRRPKSP